MALTVNTNIASLSVQKNLNRSSDALSTSMMRLSSGLRINSAKDDAAGLQIATLMNSQIRGQNVAIRNASNGISFAQAAEGALNETTSILQRMRELALQARDDNNGIEQRTALNSEFQTMSNELTRIAESTKLNGRTLIDGNAGVMELQVGSDTGDSNHITLDLSNKFDATNLSVASGMISISGGDNPTAHSAADTAISAIDAALAKVTATRADLGAAQNRLTSTISNLQNLNENAAAALGRIQDVDFAAETAELTKQQTLQQASTAILAQANQLPSAVLKLLQ
ncbi:MAG TPA: flagellin domain-containing protein [Pseudomonas sp.]|uniref:flagellin domain-containing protein n=1 Tax=Pseudomonas sp. TaxID=306 RepID=UPI002ED77FF1